MKYVVKTTCFHDNRYYKKGETVEFDSAVVLPEHFELVDKPVKQEEPKEEPKPKTAAKTAKKGNQVKAKVKDYG